MCFVASGSESGAVRDLRRGCGGACCTNGRGF